MSPLCVPKGGRGMACPAPGVPLSGSVQRNKMFGAVGGGGGQATFMQHGGNGSNIAATYMQNKMRSKQHAPLSNHFAMAGGKSSQHNMDIMSNEDNVHQVCLTLKNKKYFIYYWNRYYGNHNSVIDI